MVEDDTSIQLGLRMNLQREGYEVGIAEDGALALDRIRAEQWDLVILDVNPLEDIYATDRVSMVMLNGRLYDATTLNEVATGDRRTEPFYWQ